MPRPRSTRAHQQVLEAALQHFAEKGIDATSMDAIAASSGVSKATIYKHWRDKDALCLEVFAGIHGLNDPPVEKTGDIRADLVAVLSPRPHRDTELQARMMPHFMAYAAKNPEFAKAWRARVMQPQRIQLIQLLKRAVSEGLLRQDLDFEVSVALLAGPMAYRYMATLIGRALPEDMAEYVVEVFWRAHRAEGGASRERCV